MDDQQGSTQPEYKSVSHVEKQLDEILAELKVIKGGFPENEDGSIDVAGHRKYHEEMIEAAKAQTAFWRELKLEIAKKGIWGLIIIALGLILSGLAMKTGIAWAPTK